MVYPMISFDGSTLLKSQSNKLIGFSKSSCLVLVTWLKFALEITAFIKLGMYLDAIALGTSPSLNIGQKPEA